ncbi:SacI-like domain protein (macronuclear) [Tetrahymena thermophila SB210]|uniref:SacI-like domain protein n=1 Tax=Tetrahymena thermophila (strain SB210) TaxID=312017 RepID=I7LV61_TETTS|nr:SacI-like domain protein [Tetrahymena thermophila SB210]EAR97281.3 SacI-like domain protein [Tetrahymena thermophila SB210]|eukprot:XP_001017526.3 SacI-like domain protein [Tetrahymena thermophila SB210]
MADTSSIVSDNKFLEIYSNKYILTTNLSKDQVVIDLATSELKKETRGSSGSQTLVSKVGLKAIYGICQLEHSNYLIAVTQSFTIGSLYNKNIQQLKEIQFYPINPQREINPADQKYIDMMQSIFQTKMFYFSDEYDLTNSFQRFIKNKVDKNNYNPNFCYNECYLHDFIKNGCQEWISPFISGYVKIDYCQLDDTVVNFILISRRDKRRAGMRFISRGTDLDGNPTNMAETEQIIVLTKGQYNNIYSFVQTRGSMPFLWNQKPNLKWAPRGAPIGEEAENIEFCRKHFADQEKLYSRQVLVNLIDKKGNTQLKLGQYFQKMVEALKDKNLKYIWFDFHHECRKMKYENLQKLLDMFKEDLDDIGYFEFQYTKDKIETPSIKKLQKGTVRTNCMDCLDRTNVVQSVIARKVLHQILYTAGVTSKTALQKSCLKNWKIFSEQTGLETQMQSVFYTQVLELQKLILQELVREQNKVQSMMVLIQYKDISMVISSMGINRIALTFCQEKLDQEKLRLNKELILCYSQQVSFFQGHLFQNLNQIKFQLVKMQKLDSLHHYVDLFLLLHPFLFQLKEPFHLINSLFKNQHSHNENQIKLHQLIKKQNNCQTIIISKQVINIYGYLHNQIIFKIKYLYSSMFYVSFPSQSLHFFYSHYFQKKIQILIKNKINKYLQHLNQLQDFQVNKLNINKIKLSQIKIILRSIKIFQQNFIQNIQFYFCKKYYKSLLLFIFQQQNTIYHFFKVIKYYL